MSLRDKLSFLLFHQPKAPKVNKGIKPFHLLLLVADSPSPFPLQILSSKITSNLHQITKRSCVVFSPSYLKLQGSSKGVEESVRSLEGRILDIPSLNFPLVLEVKRFHKTLISLFPLHSCKACGFLLIILLVLDAMVGSMNSHQS